MVKPQALAAGILELKGLLGKRASSQAQSTAGSHPLFEEGQVSQLAVMIESLRRTVEQASSDLAENGVTQLEELERLAKLIRLSNRLAGENFAAAFAGKFKLGFQSGTILVILLYVNYHERLVETGMEPYAWGLRQFGIWGTVAITVFSGLQYVQKAMLLYRAQKMA